MRNRSICRRLTAMLLAVATLLSLCGCGKSDSEPSQKTIDYDPASDAVISSHIDHNKKLNPEIATDREAGEFHFYVANTETMQGFVCDKVTAYQDAVTSAFNAAYDIYNVLYSHSMTRMGSSGLYWGEEETVDDQFLGKVLSSNFYAGNVLPTGGAIPALFRGDVGTPFQEDALTVIVSNFVEPYFDLTSLSVGIEKYFSEYNRSAACVIGFSSYFEGNFHVPQSGTKDKTTFFLKNFKGNVPCYMVVVGPEADVKQYTEKLFEYLGRRKVVYNYEHYTNSLYEQVFANPLTFDVIEDPKLKKAPTTTALSYNTGNLTEHESGSAYFSTYTGVETRDGNTGDASERKTLKDRKAEREKTEEAAAATVAEEVDENAVKVSKSTQISLISRNYDGVSQYALAEPALYVYDRTTGEWKDAGKNAQKLITTVLEPKTGLTETHMGQEYTVLADNREEIYVSAKLDFETDGILSRSEIYRLELKVLLEQDMSAGENSISANGSGLSDFSITATDYYKFRDDMIVGDDVGNYIWTALRGNVQEKTAKILAHTPGLDALLISLRDMEDNYMTDIEMYSYLDFVFNIPDKEARR